MTGAEKGLSHAPKNKKTREELLAEIAENIRAEAERRKKLKEDQEAEEVAQKKEKKP